LLTAFLVVTIIPLIILAFYFEDSIKDKLENSIRLNLMAQSDRTANFLERHGNSSKITLRDLIIKANTDLDINFTLFSENEVKYSTYLDYYYLGELSFYLDYSTYKDFEKNKISETFIKTSLNKQPVYSYYKKIFLQGKYYILEVNDSVNRFYMVFDTSEINLFLYGIYSFAIIIIVLMSILLTKRISKPILNLTKAAGEVANGNFDISLEIKEKEI
jgi:nitrogen fixation/metabolism regulation signal transduction histidine kinase